VNILQAFKMAWRSIIGKKGRSALTILSIFIGIAAVMTIVSVMEGMKAQMMKQFSAMGANRVSVNIYSWMYDADGNDVSKDYFPDLYEYCQGLKEYVIGVTPNGQTNATVIYGTKNSSTMETEYDKQRPADALLRLRPVQRVQQSDRCQGARPCVSGHSEL